MLKLIKLWFKELACKIKTRHLYCVEVWHYTHGYNGCMPRYIEGFEVCLNCGKRRYFWVERGSSLEAYMQTYMCDRHYNGGHAIRRHFGVEE